MLNDQEIMTRCSQGQSSLLDLLIDRHGADLYTFCLRQMRPRPAERLQHLPLLRRDGEPEMPEMQPGGGRRLESVPALRRAARRIREMK